MSLSRRSFLAGSTGLGVAAAARRAGATEDTVVIASFGGAYQDNQRKAFFEPFQKATGIKVVEASGVTVAKLRSMVMTGNVEWDVCILGTADFPYLISQNLLEKIDYSKMDPSIVAQLDPEGVTPYGVGSMSSSQVIAYSTKAFPNGNHPKSWADVWDVRNFPGPRLLPAGNYVVQPVEPALLAAGKSLDQVYPLDLKLAYEMFTRIRPNVVRWVNSASAAPQALTDGEAVIVMANCGRIGDLKQAGAAVDFVWDQGIEGIAYWGMPRGAKNQTAAMKFMEFAAHAEPQAAMARLTPLGPVNALALDLLDDNLKRQLPTFPDNKRKQLAQKIAAWSEIGPTGRSYYDENLKMWTAWVSG